MIFRKNLDKLSENYESFGIALTLFYVFRYAKNYSTFEEALEEGMRIFPKGNAIIFSGSGITSLSYFMQNGLSLKEAAACHKKHQKLLHSKFRSTGKSMFSRLGKKAPSLKVSHVLEKGGPKSLAEFKGKVVLLHFFESGNGEESFGFLKQLLSEYQNKGLQVIGVTHFTGVFMDSVRSLWKYATISGKGLNQKEELKLIEEYRSAHGCSWPFWIHGSWKHKENEGRKTDRRPNNLKAYGSETLPLFVVIDRAGIVRHLHAMSERMEDLEKIVVKMLKEPVPKDE